MQRNNQSTESIKGCSTEIVKIFTEDGLQEKPYKRLYEIYMYNQLINACLLQIDEVCSNKQVNLCFKFSAI